MENLTEPLLNVAQVTKIYGKPPRIFTAIRDINLSIQPGEFVCLLGPSGCGKSTLLRIIAGLAQPSSGQVLYRGHVVEGVNPHTTIVFQSFALYPWLTVRENVEVALQARNIAEAERHRRGTQLVDLVGLDGFEGAYPRELSGGMRQKVGFARAMAMEPELLCLDEPFSALDILSAEALRGELMELWLSRSIPTQAILMVTHNIEEAVLMADRIVVMAKDPGRVLTEIPVRLGHPRARKDTAFQALVDRVYAAVAGRTGADADMFGTVPGTSGQTRKLPAARLDAVAGLVEKAVADAGRTDLYRLAGELQLALDELLPLVEAAELLGLARVEQGDFIVLPTGKSYAEATILVRKELIAGRILRIPTLRWIYETLQQDDNQRVNRDYFVHALQKELGKHAESQLDTAVNWGRYAELFAYDHDSHELFLES
jgi:NitT/TauT family transport system ATP-binding protein